ncbi:circadian clock-controlled protein daywake-like [Pectinophora gossypiella]|uniref:circadian clock-controlled protein daywake-like n=1 Tax=Pectinophora gossypiella TaxID=13191 RepID=UPI00214E8855|nr:circadian clock-controlled protein daywake-like [Pectinophora gossypiella]
MFLLKVIFVVISIIRLKVESIQPCKTDDQTCINNSANAAYAQIIDGVQSAGIERIDPMVIDTIDGDLSGLKFKLTGTIVQGFKECVLKHVKLDLDNMSLTIDMTCPWMSMTGHYEMSGRLIVLEIRGEGDYSIKSGRYNIGLECQLKKVKGKDGKEHLNIKTFKPTLTAEEPVAFDFKNLFNGQKELADAVLMFANENWKEVADLLQGPVFNADFKKIISNTNKYLKTVTFEDLFIQ